jgi:hypothetical protein
MSQRRLLPVVLVAAALLTPGCQSPGLDAATEVATPVSTTRWPVGFEIHVGGRVGRATGHLQTPRGGMPGTTSPERPTLEEIGADTGAEITAGLLARWGRHEVALGNSILFLQGDNTLSRDLTSQADFYAAGTSVESDSWISFHDLAYRYAFPVPLGACDGLTVRPEVGGSAFHLEYLLKGSNGEDADRSYTHVAPHLGLGIAWRRRGSPVSFEARARQTLVDLMPDDRQVDLFEVTGRVRYDLGTSLSLDLETGWRRLRFQDDQTVPNDLDVKFGPWIGLGLDWRL